MEKYLILFNVFSDNTRGEYVYMEANSFVDCIKQWLAQNGVANEIILKGLSAMETIEQAIKYANMFLSGEEEIIDIVKVNYMAIYNVGVSNKNAVAKSCT